MPEATGVALSSGPGVTGPKSRCSGFSRPRWIEESSLVVLSGPLDQRRPRSTCSWLHGVADAPLEGSQRFLLGLPFGELALVVGPAGRVVADLGNGGHVDGVVQLAIAA